MLKGKENKKISNAVHSLDCTHDWQFVQDRRTIGDSPGAFHMHALAYCPLCKTSQLFKGEDWEAIQKIQEIQKKYKR